MEIIEEYDDDEDKMILIYNYNFTLEEVIPETIFRRNLHERWIEMYPYMITNILNLLKETEGKEYKIAEIDSSTNGSCYICYYFRAVDNPDDNPTLRIYYNPSEVSCSISRIDYTEHANKYFEFLKQCSASEKSRLVAGE